LHVMLDTNVVLRAVRELLSPSVTRPIAVRCPRKGIHRLRPRPSRGQRVESLHALMVTLFNCELTPVAGPRLLEEYERNLRRYHDDCWKLRDVVSLLRLRCKVVRPDEELVKLCRDAHPKGDSADAEHAAVCLQTNAVLLTFDPHFSEISARLEKGGEPLTVLDPYNFLCRVTGSRGE